MTWVCREYLPRTAAVTTVNESIAHLYQRDFGVSCEVVRNAIGRAAAQPITDDSGVSDPMVHSGGAVPGRSIETLIDATKRLDERFTLDLYLVKARGSEAYWQSLVARAGETERVKVHPPVTPAQLPSTLDAFDVGVYVLPPRTMNNRLMLRTSSSTSFGRLALVFSTAVETDHSSIGTISAQWCRGSAWMTSSLRSKRSARTRSRDSSRKPMPQHRC